MFLTIEGTEVQDMLGSTFITEEIEALTAGTESLTTDRVDPQIQGLQSKPYLVTRCR